MTKSNVGLEIRLEPEVGELVFVEWRDATSDDSWMTRKKALKFKPMTCHSVGWIIAKDADRIVLAGDRWAEPKGQVGGVTAIPADWITEIIPLELV